MSSVAATAIFVTMLVLASGAVSASPVSPASGKGDKATPNQSSELQELMPVDKAHLLKRSLRNALQDHFDMLRDAEEDLLQRIENLKARRLEISQRKRSHYMCLVNLVACFK